MKTKKPTKKKKPRAAAKKTPKQPVNGIAPKRNTALIALLDQWMNEPPGDDVESWPEFKAALERNRAGERRLFRD